MIIVPFHQDERLPDATFPVPGGEHTVVAPGLPDGDGWPRLVALYDAVARAVAASAEPPVVVSGDCLVALGVVAGVQRAGVEPSIVWFDAHGDVHTLETTTSGYLGGLSLRLVLGAHADLVAGPLGLRPLAEPDAVLVDARDLDPAEAAYLAGSRVRRCAVADVEAPPGPVVLHVDADVIDGADLPGLRFPTPGGPPAADVLAAIRRILDTGRVVALHLAATWFPDGDEAATTRQRELLAALGR
jgi:arginase